MKIKWLKAEKARKIIQTQSTSDRGKNRIVGSSQLKFLTFSSWSVLFLFFIWGKNHVPFFSSFKQEAHLKHTQKPPKTVKIMSKFRQKISNAGLKEYFIFWGQQKLVVIIYRNNIKAIGIWYTKTKNSAEVTFCNINIWELKKRKEKKKKKEKFYHPTCCAWRAINSLKEKSSTPTVHP